MEDRGPFFIAERVGVGAGDNGVIGSAKSGRRGYGGTLVIGPNGAASEKAQRNAADEERSFQKAGRVFHASPPWGRGDRGGPWPSPDSGRCGESMLVPRPPLT